MKAHLGQAAKLSLTALAAILGACSAPQEPTPPGAPPAPPPGSAGADIAPPRPAADSTADAGAAASATPAAPTGPTPAPVLRFTTGLATPESVLYDAAADRYLVSNIQGKPPEADGNGYISELSPEGTVTKEKFIAGGVNKVKLDAPKGLALSGGTLYVADITVVRKFDAKTGAPKGEIPIKGSTFLNDIALGPDGQLYVSDSGLKAEGNGLGPTGTDAVYVIDKAGKVKPLAKSKELAGPNGLAVVDKSVLVVSFGSNELYRLEKDTKDGARKDVTKLPEGALDGILVVGDSLIVSSWGGSAIYRGKLNETFSVVVSGVSAPADIGLDTKRNRLLVPRFMDNAVDVYELK